MRIEHGDCLDVMARLIEEGVVVDSIVTDPPYHLTAGKKGGSGEASVNLRSPAGQARITTGFMGKKWDGGNIAFRPEVWKLAIQILKPGGHMLVFGGTRTYHKMACAVEDAGFEIRDQVGWLFGSGFPKSHDVSKGIDRAAGVKRGSDYTPNFKNNTHGKGWGGGTTTRTDPPATEAAQQWTGWGTALKPAWEPIVLARKPLSEKTIAANVLEHGTGALNVDGCRVETSAEDQAYIAERITGFNKTQSIGGKGIYRGGEKMDRAAHDPSKGRWPANVIHDGSPEVMEAFARFGERNPHDRPRATKGTRPGGFVDVGSAPGGDAPCGEIFGDTGTAARFFYTAKADRIDRCGSRHPTVKPVDLIAYLCRLITPPKGLILDPFAGSGTTGMACMREGFRCILIEREDEYIDDIRRRLKHVKGEDSPLFAALIKTPPCTS